MAAVERAAAAERAELVPVGEATEITPESVKPAPGLPDEKLPVGEATEITPENVEPAPEVKEHPEAKIRQDIASARPRRRSRLQPTSSARAAAAETDPRSRLPHQRADAIAPAKKQEKTDGTPSEPVGTGGVRKEASVKKVYRKTVTLAPKSRKGGEEARPRPAEDRRRPARSPAARRRARFRRPRRSSARAAGGRCAARWSAASPKARWTRDGASPRAVGS